MMPNHSLLQVARLTPPSVDIDLVDENHELINWANDYDLVGITCMTYQASRGYQIGDEFRKRGITVVMGGFHPTFLYDECLAHADAVVIGEAEGIWEKVLFDFQSGNLQKYYQSETPTDFHDLPPPRYDLLKLKNFLGLDRYIFIPLFASRGCPFRCDFCSIRRFYREKFRTRPVEDVVQDIEICGVKKTYCLTDDNFIADWEYAERLVKAFIPLGIEWMGQCDISIGGNERFLELARESGLTMLYIGLETITPENLRDSKKRVHSIEEYQRYLENLRKAGISCVASMMFGFERDDRTIFKKTVEFLIKNRVPGYVSYILTPFPGSELNYRLGQEGRYLPVNLSDFDLYDGSHALFQPCLMSPEELEEGLWWTYRKFYSFFSIVKRCFFPPNLSLRKGRGVIYSLRMLVWRFVGNMLVWFRMHIMRDPGHPFHRY